MKYDPFLHINLLNQIGDLEHDLSLISEKLSFEKERKKITKHTKAYNIMFNKLMDLYYTLEKITIYENY